MGVRKRHNKWWIDFSFEGERYRKPSPENSKAGALAYELVMKQRLAKDEPAHSTPKHRQTFDEFSGKWFEIYVKTNNKPSEVRSKEYTLRLHLVPFFGRFKLGNIRNIDIEKYKSKKLEAGLNPKSINNHLTILSKCLRTAVEWEETTNFPLIKKLKVPPQRFDFLNEEECELLKQSASGYWKDMIKVALETGLRFGELTALTWEDVNLDKGELTIGQAFSGGVLGSTKGNKIRRVPMTDAVYETLDKMKKRQGYVFQNSQGLPLSQSSSIKKLHKTCERAGIRRIGWHTLRHTFASHLAQSGANIVAIQQLLGHTDIKTTMRYAHINRDVLKVAIGNLNKAKEGVEGTRHNSVTDAIN
jgi:integrase